MATFLFLICRPHFAKGLFFHRLEGVSSTTPRQKTGKKWPFCGLLLLVRRGSARYVSLHGQEGPVKLAPRQWEILKKAAQGLSMKEIARALAISPRTVETSLQISKGKVGLLSRDQLSKFVRRNTVI